VLFSDLTPPTSLDSIDPDLHDAHGFSAEAGVRGVWFDFLRADASLFYMKYDQRIGVLQRTRDDLSTYLFRTNLGTTFHKGVECYLEISPLRLLERQTKVNLSLWTAISLLDAKYGSFALATPVNGKSNLEGNRVEYAPERIHRAGLTLLAGDFRFDLNYSYTSSVFADAGNTETPSVNAQVGIVPAWTVWDASASYQISKHFDVHLNISNLSDVRYATRRSGGYPGPGLLPGEARTFIVGAGVKF
jgi:Fe(3+) dicitrate transport protein